MQLDDMIIGHIYCCSDRKTASKFISIEKVMMKNGELDNVALMENSRGKHFIVFESNIHNQPIQPECSSGE